jgi:hypothetical protein
MSKTRPVNFVIRNIGYVLLLAGLGLVYLYISHSSESKLREIQKLKVERQDAHDRYIQLKQKVMHGSTASELDKALRDRGLERQSKTPVVIDGNGENKVKR